MSGRAPRSLAWWAGLGGLAVVGVGGLAAVAAADPPAPIPYRIWWSFPNDDDTAIEVDNPDLTGSHWEDERWKFAVAMLKCDARRSKILAQHKDGTPVREIRVESLEPDGKVRATSRCVMTLQAVARAHRQGRRLSARRRARRARRVPHAAARPRHAGQVDAVARGAHQGRHRRRSEEVNGRAA